MTLGNVLGVRVTTSYGYISCGMMLHCTTKAKRAQVNEASIRTGTHAKRGLRYSATVNAAEHNEEPMSSMLGIGPAKVPCVVTLKQVASKQSTDSRKSETSQSTTALARDGYTSLSNQHLR